MVTLPHKHVGAVKSVYATEESANEVLAECGDPRDLSLFWSRPWFESFRSQRGAIVLIRVYKCFAFFVCDRALGGLGMQNSRDL